MLCRLLGRLCSTLGTAACDTTCCTCFEAWPQIKHPTPHFQHVQMNPAKVRHRTAASLQNLKSQTSKKQFQLVMWTRSAVMIRRHKWLTGLGDAGVELLDVLAKVGLSDDPSSALLAAALQHRWPMLALLAACHGCTPLLCMATWLRASLCPSNAAPDGEPHSPVGTAALLRLLN